MKKQRVALARSPSLATQRFSRIISQKTIQISQKISVLWGIYVLKRIIDYPFLYRTIHIKYFPYF